MPAQMGDWDIAFPNLNLYLHNVPKTISIFGLDITLYGIIIATAMFVGFYINSKEGKRLGQPDDIWWDFILYGIISSVIGARIYYVIFSWDQYKAHPLQIFNIRGGGLAIYGGVIGAVIALFVFARIKAQPFLGMVDAGVFGLLAGQIIGRWGNFTNREVFGGYTNSLFAMRLPLGPDYAPIVRPVDITPGMLAMRPDGANYIQVHPTFLYEGFFNLLLLVAMLLYRKHKKFNGEMGLWYLGGYGIIRFFVEGIRVDRLKIGSTNIAISQVLGMTLFVVSLVTLVICHIRIRKKSVK